MTSDGYLFGALWVVICYTALPTCNNMTRNLGCMSNDPRRDVGAIGERLAAEHLERRGYKIVERNYRTRCGELDIIASDGTTLVFCEVKSRLVTPRRTGVIDGHAALESVRAGKRLQVRRLAGRWLSERARRPRVPNLRFDAIGVTVDSGGRLVALEHVEDAF
jgi:putative endonuclease